MSEGIRKKVHAQISAVSAALWAGLFLYVIASLFLGMFGLEAFQEMDTITTLIVVFGAFAIIGTGILLPKENYNSARFKGSITLISIAWFITAFLLGFSSPQTNIVRFGLMIAAIIFGVALILIGKKLNDPLKIKDKLKKNAKR